MKTPRHEPEDVEDSRTAPVALRRGQRARLVAGCLVIFLAAVGVRFFTWQDGALEAGKVQSAVTGDYKHVARLLAEGGVAAFFSPDSPLSNPDTLGHPPGYSIFIALVYRICGESDAALQAVQVVADALAAVVVFLIVAELPLPWGVRVIAGLLAAFAPQFAWNSILLLPDTLAVLPVLVAALLLLKAVKRPRLATVFAAGALIGLSCWLRANAMLLAPFLAVVVLPLVLERGDDRRRRTSWVLLSLSLILGSAVVIAPLTIRNALVFGHFIPLSLGAGQTLLEGISDYDRKGEFGLPNTDLGIMRMEAVEHQRPDYAETLFGRDGVRRERARMARGFRIIRENPVWFAGVMLRRAASMFKLERARAVSAVPPVTHSLDATGEPVWSRAPAELLATGNLPSSETRAALDPLDGALLLKGDATKYGAQFVSEPLPVRADTDYVLSFPVKLEEGRLIVTVARDAGAEPYVSTNIDTLEGKTPDEQPTVMVRLPFVSWSDEHVRLVIGNGASNPLLPSARIGEAKLHALGAATNVWTRWPRLLVRSAQRLFLTAVSLPLVIAGIILLLRRGRDGERRWRVLLLLLAVPAYYLCVQSALHTEYRYVLVIHHFLFVLAALALQRLASVLLLPAASAARRNLARRSARA